ncbi:hypothetical protein ACHWQZ_G010721 [Mnemiopsis leidyi]
MTTLRRNLKNTVNNYTDIQCKVREATCNEPWGPATTVMTEIADATYSVVEFAEIMTILWKRLNDHGKNWRHVYKALLVLDYIIKRGSERVAQQCKEQIYSLLTLQDFRFVDKDGKDQGASVREKARQLVTLLKDDDRLKSERKKALQAKERFAQNSTGIGSTNSKIPKPSGTLGGFMGRTGGDSSRSSQPAVGAAGSSEPQLSAALEQARPSDRDEEDLQLELALAISKEEAEKDREEDEALKAILERSKTETRIEYTASRTPEQPKPTLLSISKQPPPRPPSTPLDPWGMPLMPGSSSTAPEPSRPAPAAVPLNDPWAPALQSGGHFGGPSLLDTSLDDGISQPANYAVINTTANKPSQPAAADLIDPWGAPVPASNFNSLQGTGVLQPHSTISQPANSSHNLLGDLDVFGTSALSSTPPLTTPQIPPHVPMVSSSATLQPSSKMGTILDNRTKHLVNIDNLISTQTPSSGSTNPFGNPRPAPGSVFSGASTNPFLSNSNNSPNLSLNELRSPTGASNNTNPFA